jgi:cell wall-associated NlpC family hydrolase
VVAALLVPAVSARSAAASTGHPISAAAEQALGYLRAWGLTSIDPARWDDFVGVDPELTALSDGVRLTRRALADAVAPAAGVSADELDAVWARTPEPRLVAMYAALGQVGVPYRRNTSAPGRGFDCSGLTAYAWGEAGVGLVRQSGSQIRSSAGRSLEEARPGDLVWYPGHIMMYLGAGRAIVHAPQSGKRVEVKPASRISRIGSPLG